MKVNEDGAQAQAMTQVGIMVRSHRQPTSRLRDRFSLLQRPTAGGRPMQGFRCDLQVTGGFGPPNTPPVSVRFDRPFLMAIEHYKTGALVFLGTVTRPSAYVAPVLSATRSCELVSQLHHACRISAS